jgi:hypothetical protein
MPDQNNRTTVMTAHETPQKKVRISLFLVRFVSGFVLSIQLIPLVFCLVLRDVFGIRTAPPVGIDFGIFWAAARVELEHGATAVFSPRWMQPLEAMVRITPTYGPCPYPPTFLLAIRPLGFLNYSSALILFMALGIGAYSVVTARLCGGLKKTHREALIIAAFAGVPLAIQAGQNSLFTAAAAAAALILMDSAPLGAAACLAVLAVKPQLGVLFPLALICGRKWTMLVAAIALCVLFALSSAVILGFDAWPSFFSYAAEFKQSALLDGQEGHWFGMPTLFATARLAGLSVPVAYVIQMAAAVPAALAVAYLWFTDARLELKAAALLVGSLLVQPYLMCYDLAWLGFPAALLIRDALSDKLTRMDRIAIGAVWVMPLYEFIGSMVRLPFHLAPLAMILILTAIVRRHRTSQFTTQRLSAPASERSGALAERCD